jgi:alcohol dehydrogenase class IV
MSGRPIELSRWPNSIVAERGGVARLGELVDRVGGARALVVCGRTVAEGSILQRVRDGLGRRCAGVFAGVEAHTPLPSVEAAGAAFRQAGADVIVSVGGGSATDTGKGLAVMHASDGDYRPFRHRIENGRPTATPLPAGRVPPHIAVPTVPGAGSELLSSCGVLDPVRRAKMRFVDPALVPRISLVDAEIVALCGRDLTVSTGVAILVRCIEVLYSRERNPVSDALVLHALRLVVPALPLGLSRPDDLDAREACLYAALMSTLAAMNAEVSVAHALGSAVAARYLLPHGVPQALLLPIVMADLLPPAGLPLLDDAVAAAPAGADAPARIGALVQGLGVGPRLRDLGVPEADLPALAEEAARHTLLVHAPRPITPAELSGWLGAAW